MTFDENPSGQQDAGTEKRAWQAPRVITGELGDAETNVLPGTEIIIYVS